MWISVILVLGCEAGAAGLVGTFDMMGITGNGVLSW